MGNLASTSPELDRDDDISARSFRNIGKQFPTPLGLISKPLLTVQAVPEESLGKRLSNNLRDALFPKKLPPLKLISRPIAVDDPMAVKRDPMSSALSFVAHAATLAVILWFVFQARKQFVAPRPQVVTVPIYVKPYIPVTAPAPKTMGGGGGGGTHEKIVASKGHLPPVVKIPVVPVETLNVDHPKLVAAPAVAMLQRVNIPTNSAMPNLGALQSPQIALVSHGGGTGGGIGNARGGGIGSGIGAGVGPGTGGGYGGGVMSVGGGVTAPRVIHSVEPDFTDAARSAKYQGVVSIQLIVDSHGSPQDIHVIRHLGMGLDQKAVAAVRQYRFKPAMYEGHPVAVQMVIDIDFHLD